MAAKPIASGMSPPPPGAFLREEVLGPLGISISKAAEIMKLRRPTLSDVVNGKARLSPDIALRFELAFGVSMSLLMRMQTSYEIAQARARADSIDVRRYEPESQ